MMIKAIIIDDEVHCVETLRWQVEKYCPGVTVVACAYSAAEGIEAIAKYSPHLIFLDIEMPRMNGFEMLQVLPQIDFDIIFTTAYDQFAIRAIKFSALDYLLKPIDQEELKAAVAKMSVQANTFISTRQLDLLLSNISHGRQGLQQIALPTLEGYELVPADTIVRCESDSNYTIVYFKNATKLVVSKTLKEVEDLLEGRSFLRVHHSHLVNLNEIKKYIKGDGGYLIMSDKAAVNVARSKKEALLKFF